MIFFPIWSSLAIGLGSVVCLPTLVPLLAFKVEAPPSCTKKLVIVYNVKDGWYGSVDNIGCITGSLRFCPITELGIGILNSGSAAKPNNTHFHFMFLEPSEVVIVIGNSASGQDISRELARVAKEVHLSARSTCPEVNMMKSATGYSKIWLHSMIDSAYEDGRVTFQDGASVFADTIIHCTGYSYHFPFLDTKGIVNVTDNRVGPLYEHVFPPLLAPSLSFVGLPWKVIPFPLCELQSKWIACTLSGKAVLPSEEDMMESVTDFYAHIEAVGLPKHHTHNIGHYQCPFGCRGQMKEEQSSFWTCLRLNLRGIHPPSIRRTLKMQKYGHLHAHKETKENTRNCDGSQDQLMANIKSLCRVLLAINAGSKGPGMGACSMVLVWTGELRVKSELTMTDLFLFCMRR
eukprot:Gb_30033 [translate_table: standard]